MSSTSRRFRRLEMSFWYGHSLYTDFRSFPIRIRTNPGKIASNTCRYHKSIPSSSVGVMVYRPYIRDAGVLAVYLLRIANRPIWRFIKWSVPWWTQCITRTRLPRRLERFFLSFFFFCSVNSLVKQRTNIKYSRHYVRPYYYLLYCAVLHAIGCVWQKHLSRKISLKEKNNRTMKTKRLYI